MRRGRRHRPRRPEAWPARRGDISVASRFRSDVPRLLVVRKRERGERCSRDSDGSGRQRRARCLGDEPGGCDRTGEQRSKMPDRRTADGLYRHDRRTRHASTIDIDDRLDQTGLRRNEHLGHESVADPGADRRVDSRSRTAERVEGPLCETGRTPPPSIVERVDDPRCHERMGTGGVVGDGVGEPVVLIAEARRSRATSPNVAPPVGRGTTGTPAAAARSGAHEAADGRSTATPSTSTVGGASPPDTRAQRCRRRRRRPDQDRPTTPSAAPTGPAVPEQSGHRLRQAPMPAAPGQRCPVGERIDPGEQEGGSIVKRTHTRPAFGERRSLRLAARRTTAQLRQERRIPDERSNRFVAKGSSTRWSPTRTVSSATSPPAHSESAARVVATASGSTSTP